MTPGTIHVRAGKDYVVALHTTHSMNPERIFKECALMPFFLIEFNQRHHGYVRPIRVIMSMLETMLKRYKRAPTALTVYRLILDWLTRDLSFATSPEIFSNWIILRSFNQFAPLPHKNEHGKKWDEFRPSIVIDVSDGRGLPQLTIKPNDADTAELTYPYFDEIISATKEKLFQFAYLYRFNRVTGSVTYSPDKVLAALIALEWERQQRTPSK